MSRQNQTWNDLKTLCVSFLVSSQFGKMKDISCPCMINLLHRLHLKIQSKTDG